VINDLLGKQVMDHWFICWRRTPRWSRSESAAL